MGPQHVRCGMVAGGGACMTTASLQWGRNMFVAECRGMKPEKMKELNLQWGRNMFVAECNVPKIT